MSKKLGPTGEYPDGKIHADDAGELRMKISSIVTTSGPQVQIEFGAPTKWLAMPPDMAMELARVLVLRARELMA